MLLVIVATVLLHAPNSPLVPGALCAVEVKPLSELWQSSYFWLMPYYIVGGTAAALIVTAERVAGWLAALAIMPVMALAYVSYARM